MQRDYEIELRARELADVYMDGNPGVPRQEAKRLVRPAAIQSVAIRCLNRQVKQTSEVIRRSMKPAIQSLRKMANTRAQLSGRLED